MGIVVLTVPWRLAPDAQEIKKFAKPLALSCVAVFGGSGVANQISELKRGTEVVVCTPGRMIDLLVTSNGGLRSTTLPAVWTGTLCSLYPLVCMQQQVLGPWN